MHHSFTILAMFMVFLSSVALADEGGKRTVRLLYISAPADAPKVLHLHDGQSRYEVPLPRMNLSQVYEMPAGALTMHLHAEPHGEDVVIADGLPSIVITEELQHIYLVLRYDADNKVLPLKMEVVNAGYDRIGRGQMLWVNDSECVVSGMVGSQVFKKRVGSI